MPFGQAPRGRRGARIFDRARQWAALASAFAAPSACAGPGQQAPPSPGPSPSSGRRAAHGKAPPGAAPSAATADVRPAPAGPADAPDRASRAQKPHEPAGQRVYAKTRFVWIRERPEWSSQWIGYLWSGGSVALRSPRPIYARGCDAWYAVLPRGYVCVDRRRATLDPADPELALLEKTGLREARAPHRYAESLGAERYEKLPDGDEQRAREPDLDRHLALLEQARQGGARDPTLTGIDLAPAPRPAVAFAAPPIDLQIPRRTFRRDSTIAFLDEYLHEGRSFLLTSDLAWVPKDRVRPYPSITFEGVRLDGSVRLPIAFFRERERPAFERGESAQLSPSARAFARLAWVELTGREEEQGDVRYLETREHGLWVLEADCVVPRPSERTPWGARVGSLARSSGRSPKRTSWVESSVYGGWLIAYEGTLPVFTTLVAAGRGGAKSASAKNLLETSSTPVGQFPITGKFATATMDGPEDVTHSDVPLVQDFRGAHAIHAAYWHDAWGERVSGGCLNVSPADGRWLFDFTDPKLPEGWHAV